MGRTLSIASEKEAYTLTDAAPTSLRNTLDLEILVEGDAILLNISRHAGEPREVRQGERSWRTGFRGVHGVA